MRNTKPVGKRSLLKGLLRALGIERDSASPLLSNLEAQPGVSMNYPSHVSRPSVLQEAEQARANAIKHAYEELQRKSIL